MNLDIDDVRLDLPATNKYLNVLGACLDAFIERIEGVEEPRVTAYNIQLAVNEIMANIIAHAYGERVDGRVNERAEGRVEVVIRLLRGPRRLLVALFDSGAAFDPEGVASPDLDDVQIHGYGLFLARSLMDDVSYDRLPDGNVWQLVTYL